MDFSILIAVPTLNSMNLIPSLINSLRNQTSFKWKLLFIDASTSKKEYEYIMKICQSELNCFYLKEEGKEKGIYHAMNLAFNYVDDKDWLLFWGSDDYAATNEVIEKISTQIINNIKKSFLTDLIIYSGQYVNKNNSRINRKTFFSKKLEFLNSKQFRRKLFLGFSLPHQATVFSPFVRKKLKSYSTDLFLASDLDYFLKLSKSRDLLVQSIPSCIVSMGDNGVSSKRNILRFYEVIKSYYSSFGIISFIPFILRYLRRFISLKFKD